MPELDLGNVKGPQGKSAYQSALDAGYSGSEEAFNKAMAKAPDAVFYTAQSLTDKQQAQARGNINAAPGGFGLGGGSKQISSWDDVRDNGWYYGPAPAGIGNGNLWGRVDALSSTYAVQTIYSDTYVASVKRFLIANAWKPWEWINPPMDLGVEYRTTERYLGKPVYVKTFNIPTSAFTNQKVSYAHGIASLNRIVDAFVCCRADAIRIFPWSYYDTMNWSAQYMVARTAVNFELGSNALNRINEYSNGVDVTLKYTKTTD